jgi:mono/diheme cytochrome c family protein
MTKTTIPVLCAGALFAVSVSVVVGAQGSKAASEGVFTAEQAQRGEMIYKEQCAACHGDNLEGSGPMPPLAGKDFLSNWQDKSLGDLYEKTQTSMPATAPGTLSPQQAADTLAFLLSSGKYPAGAAALEGKMDALALIKLDAPKP